MASFFDDEAEDDAYARRSDDEHAVYNARAGPSRRPASDTGQDNDRRSPSPPPPLAGGSKQTTSTSHDKGKARAINHNNGNPQRHARASSTMSIDLDINTRNRGYNNTTTGVGQTRRRDRGFLADEEDDADITLNTTHRGRAGNEVQDETIDDDNGNNESDIQHLMRLYMDERMSPELLSFPEELIASLMQNLEAQVGRSSFSLCLLEGEYRFEWQKYC